MNHRDDASIPVHVRESITLLFQKGEITERQHEQGLRLAHEPWFVERLLSVRSISDPARRTEEYDRLFGPRGDKKANQALPVTTAEHLAESIPRVRLWLIYPLIVLWSAAPLIPNPAFKTVVLGILSVVIIQVLLDLFKHSSAKVEALTARLDRALADVEKQYFLDRRDLARGLHTIQSHLREPTPPTFPDFTAVLPVMKALIVERLEAGQNVHLRVMAISGQFTWKHLLFDGMETFVKYMGKSQKIRIEFVVVSQRTLEKWGQETLKIHKDSMERGVAVFRRNYSRMIDEGSISLRVEEYDNLPHWHGIMVDDDALFLGRTSWRAGAASWELSIGQNVYRQFFLQDRFRGAERIEQFRNWFDAYLGRSRPVAGARGDDDGAPAP